MSIPRVGGIPQTMLEQLREAGVRIAELEAERDALVLKLHEWEESDASDTTVSILVELKERLEAENARLKERNETLEAKMERALVAVAHFTHRYNEDLKAIAENALLRKALEDAPHASDCHWRSSYCCCWKSRIPEARP